MYKTKYVVRAITNGTGINLPVSAPNPKVAIERAKVKRLARTATLFICYDRATNWVLETGVR